MTPRRRSSRASKKRQIKKGGHEGTPNGEQSEDSSDHSSKSREPSEETEDRSSSSNKTSTVQNTSESSQPLVESEENDETSSDDDAEPIVLNITERAKRATAGNKMAALLASADKEDDFYKTAYGGFEENNEIDKEFKSPVHSDEDEVDSDFDKSEEEDEPVSGGEEDGQTRRKKRRFNEPKRGMTADDILAKNKKWAMARLSGNIVAANILDDKSQLAMLKEAEITEKINVESLKKYEAFEIERKKKREKNTVRIFPPGPREQIKMTSSGTTVTVSNLKVFKCERPRQQSLCAVTGRPAKYFDPITKLPYSTPYAFKVIRDRYNKYLRTIKGNEEVTAYLNSVQALPTPPLSPAKVTKSVEYEPVTSGPIVPSLNNSTDLTATSSVAKTKTTTN